MRPSLFFILLALLCFQLMLQAQPAIDVPIFVERFSGQPGARWTIATNPETQGLRWYKENERPGFTFLARSLPAYMKTGDYAYAAWPVGTRPFELNWDVTLDQAFSQTWFYPGVAVALSSAPADKMTEKDISVTIAVNFAGVACSVRQGDLYELCKGPYPAPNSSMGDRQLSNTAERRGDIPSISWPDRYVDGTKLSLRITRDENSLLTFTVYNSQLPEGATKPWDVERWQMPQYIAQIPLNYIVIKRIPVLSVHQGYAGFIYRGTVNNIQGRLLSAAAAPHVTGYTPGKPVLNSSVPIILQGEGFTRMTQVRIAGKAGKVHYISPKELRVILPALPVNMRYPCEIRNADGQTTDLSDGLPYGRLLERVEPHEALPVGGDIVTLLGAGFEKNTTVLVGGKQAEIVQLINAGKMKVRVPAGTPDRQQWYSAPEKYHLWVPRILAMPVTPTCTSISKTYPRCARNLLIHNLPTTMPSSCVMDSKGWRQNYLSPAISLIPAPRSSMSCSGPTCLLAIQFIKINCCWYSLMQ